LRFINGKLHTFHALTRCACHQLAQNEFSRIVCDAAIKRRFIIHPVQWDAASALGPARPCAIGLILLMLCFIPSHTKAMQSLCVHAERRLLFYACTKNQLVADAARVVPLSLSFPPDLSPAPPSIFACKKCSHARECAVLHASACRFMAKIAF
jgi:hypothetical protein